MRDIVTKETGSFFTGLAALPVIKTSQKSAGVDLANYNGATIYLLAGNWTDGTLTPVIQESDTDVDGNYASVAAADLITWAATSATDHTPSKTGNAQPAAISSAATAINQRVGYIGGKRWIRVNMTVTGSPSTGCGYDAIIQAGEARNLPPAV